jgi:hypothetical protein
VARQDSNFWVQGSDVQLAFESIRRPTKAGGICVGLGSAPTTLERKTEARLRTGHPPYCSGHLTRAWWIGNSGTWPPERTCSGEWRPSLGGGYTLTGLLPLQPCYRSGITHVDEPTHSPKLLALWQLGPAPSQRLALSWLKEANGTGTTACPTSFPPPRSLMHQ